MITTRFTLTLMALAACRLASAQGDATVLPGSVLSTGDGLPAASTPQQSTTTQPRLLRGTDKVIAAPPPTPPLTGPTNTFRFEDAPILDVVHVVLRDILKVDYMVHPPISGTVTLATKGPVSADEAAYMLEGALLANGLVMAQDSRGAYHVGRPEALRGIVSVPRQVGNGPLAPGYGAIVVPLNYIGAAEMATILRPMMPPDALVRVDSVRNLIVLAGTRTQAEGWLSIVSTFDIDLLKGMSVGLFPLKYTSVREVEAMLRMISGGRPSPAGSAVPPPLQAGAAAAAEPLAGLGDYPSLGGVKIMPIERLNSILIVSPRAASLDEARRWLERLDRPGLNLAEETLHVYRVENGSARHLADVLNGIFGGGESRSAPPVSGVAPGLSSSSASSIGMTGAGGLGGSSGYGGSTGFGGGTGLGGALQTGQPAGSQSASPGAGAGATLKVGGMRVVADEVNNSILVWGTAAEFAKIEASLRRLDVPPTQVLIEASIVEVTLNDDMQYGLQWTFDDSHNGKVGTGVLSNLAGGVLGGPQVGFSYALRNSAGNVRAILNALADKSLVKVISSPSLMVLDNYTAQIVVGNQQPIQSGTTVTTGGVITNSIQYKDTGVALAVTPSVNAGNMVTLSINQAVTDVGQIDTATGQRAFLQRQITSKVAVRSGETLVLGGLIRDNSTTGSSGIPVLHEIPIFGALFGTKNNSGQRTELLVIITPRVVRSDQDARDVSAEIRDRMKSFIGYEPFGKNAPAAPAAAPALPQDPNRGGPNVP